MFLDMYKRQFGVVLALLLFVSVPSARAQRTTVIFTPSHRVAEELMPVAEAVIGAEGEAILDPQRNALILIGPKEAVDQTLDLLRRQDRGVPTVRIRYQTLALSELDEAGLEIAWQAGIGIGVGRVSVASGGSQADSGVRGVGRLYRTGQSQSFAGTLQIQSGSTGHVGRGRSVPLEGRDLFGRVVPGDIIVSAERGFSASPRVLGDGRIQLEFSNSEATVDDEGRVAFSNATTTLIVDSGETVAIGSLAQTGRIEQRGGKSYSTRISKRSSEETQIFLLTLDVEGHVEGRFN